VGLRDDSIVVGLQDMALKKRNLALKSYVLIGEVSDRCLVLISKLPEWGFR